jgi:hypothetical protein
MQPGDQARCLIKMAGVLDLESHYRPAFHPDIVVNEGELLTYVGPHPNPALERWHMFSYTASDGQTYEVPLGEGQFEAVE